MKIPQFDFELLSSLAHGDPDRYTDTRSALINSMIGPLDTESGALAELQQEIDQITVTETPPDQVMLEIVHQISSRVALLCTLTQTLKREVVDLRHALPLSEAVDQMIEVLKMDPH